MKTLVWKEMRLAQCLRDTKISYAVYAKAIGTSKSTLYAAVHTRQLPKNFDMLAAVHKSVETFPAIKYWLFQRKKTSTYLVQPCVTKFPPTERQKRQAQKEAKQKEQKEVKPAMLTFQAMKHFKMTQNPFLNDVNSTKDIYISQDHSFIEQIMLDAARHAGFVAISGEVGSGKSTMRKAVEEQLKQEGIAIVFPEIIDKRRITPSSLIDAIIYDLTEERARGSLEAKTRQASRTLRTRAKNQMKQVIIIEEAHLLTVDAFKALKQIYELEEGFGKIVGIVLIGQTELAYLLDEVKHPEMREVIRRVQTAVISGMGADTSAYLELKFKRVKKPLADVFAEGAIDAIVARTTHKMGRQTVSTAHPLTVNNIVMHAMNEAAALGEPLVTAEIIRSV